MIKHNKNWSILLSSCMLCHAFSFPQILLIQHSAQDIWYRLTSTSEANNSQLRIITSFWICQSPTSTGKMSLRYSPVVQHSHGKSTISKCISCCNCRISIAMLDYRSGSIATVALDVGPNIVRNPRPCWCGMRQEKPAVFLFQNEGSSQ